MIRRIVGMIMGDDEATLFWRGYLADQIRLNIPGVSGANTIEHIPGVYWKSWKLIHNHYVNMRFKRGLPVYYWHLRPERTPEHRKQLDLMFAAHVFLDHDGTPENKTEAKHFKKLVSQYGIEIHYFRPLLEAIQKGERHYWGAYAKAYATKWIRPIFPEVKVLYHGVDIEDYQRFRLVEDRFIAKENRKDRARLAAHKRRNKLKPVQGSDL